MPELIDVCANCNSSYGAHFGIRCPTSKTASHTMFNTFVDKKNVDQVLNDFRMYTTPTTQEKYIAMLKWIDQHREELML